MLHSKTCIGGMVTAPHHLAAQAGAAVLREGGNAVEAMVAAAAAIAVVYPHMNGIGGDGFWVISEPGHEPVAIQACGPSAGLADRDFYAGEASIPTRGPRAALTVAGAVSGWSVALAHASRWGKALPVSRLLSDAIGHAKAGVPITRSQVQLTRDKWDQLYDQPGFVDTYAPAGLPSEGDILKQPALAATLERMAHAGLDDFYRGDLANTLSSGLQQLGSPLRAADLAAYRAQMVTPLKVQLRSGSVYNLPPPTQGVSALMIIGLFDRLGVTEADGFAHIHSLVEATKRAFILRNAHVTDPAHMSVNARDWLTEALLESEAAFIRPDLAAPWPHAAKPGDTIWMGAADAQGRVVSYIQSIFWEFGSGVVVPDTGVVWQNRGASFSLDDSVNQLLPGKLPFHTLNPSLAKLNDGRTIAYGTMGGEGQPQTQAAVFTRHVMFGQNMQQAISAPRWLLGRTWGDVSTNLKVEGRIDLQTIEALRRAGHAVEIVADYADMMGHAGAVAVHPSGMIEGATDPRADGVCAGV
ncbi:gamma-glutamyltransferase family protein [Glaciimonas immobilis]|uniref:Gamma-glutamyltranspeptidase/glutathione hydrolase n=1 Tax=Glaciimonas immobilis TaxID=728004 RepID=A0A840RVW9_9BURK|nr:gamma-glutamyltransferase family protein [Glaciimonas immobilis]KAF3996601.1 gamma-glutamyltransferase family protein [Glaciimonas immobilis]MBB5201026.1 gamma-glutamyltranspeptidase/glutathione hydrolase [Glaciimonas immobilis]